MARISFKAKVKTVYNVDDTAAYQYIQVPEFKRCHCDMHSFRVHAKYGAYANSDFFGGMLKRIRADVFGGNQLRLDAIPAGVSVDTSGFLAAVTFDV
ncbi:hypothetical protein [Burkholderia cenocepacia]|uniref:hypothetical protein n=1 Tax=Burkholderia cenocepacia TaxID=95486 RepID=UPI0026510FC3|nr:hypothetical protein [Burkholderia cenocepacia]MDN7537063.1 hypothetical protein [Burkholderia cenocepacia]